MPGSPPDRPEGLRFISGLILVSSQPERVMEFYRDVLGLPLAEERHGDTQPHWGCELGDGAGLTRAEHLDAAGDDGMDWIFAANLPD